MSKINYLNSEVGLADVYDFFTKSKVGITASLVVEVASLIIGTLAVTQVLPALGLMPGAIITGLSGFFLVLTIALVINRNCSDKKRSLPENNSTISSNDPIEDNPGENNSVESNSHTSSAMHGANEEYSFSEHADSQSTGEQAAWKANLKQILKNNHQNNLVTPTGVSPQECLNALSLLALVNSISSLFKIDASYVEPKNEKMRLLVQECMGKNEDQLYEIIATAFLENLSSLTAFIRAETQKILLINSTDIRECAQFKLVNKQIRTILLFLMSHEPKRSEYLKRYQIHLTQSFGNRVWNYRNNIQPCFYFDQLLSKKEDTELDQFLFFFSIYRRHSLHHLFPKKIDIRYDRIDKALRPLLSGTWFHGTRALTSLNDTKFILMPTGWLHQLGLTSFFGEMRDGCKKNGVNANALSGTYLDHVDWSMNSYAKGFEFDIKNEIPIIGNFLNIKVDTSADYFHTGFVQYSSGLPRVEVALNRLARWDQDAFQNQKPQLLVTLEHFKEVIALIEEKKPQEIFAWGDRYYSSKYESICHSIDQIEAILTTPLPRSLTEKQKKNIEGNFPAVLGSLTLLSQPYTYDDSTGEHLLKGIAKIGKDLQLLCVEKTNLKKAHQWVKSNLPDSNIKIFTFEHLQEAQRINKIVSPYLADIFSINKFNKLCACRQI